MTEPACATSALPAETWDPSPATEDGRARSRRVWDAIAVCQTCPVLVECATVARKRQETGIWGGQYLEYGRPIPVAKPPKTDRRQKVGRPVQPIAHGTESGYRTELRRGIPHCTPCLDAARAATYRRKRERNARNRAVVQAKEEAMHASGLVTAEEAATRLRVSKMTIYRLVKQKHLQSIRVGRSIRIIEPSLIRYIRDQAA